MIDRKTVLNITCMIFFAGWIYNERKSMMILLCCMAGWIVFSILIRKKDGYSYFALLTIFSGSLLTVFNDGFYYYSRIFAANRNHPEILLYDVLYESVNSINTTVKKSEEIFVDTRKVPDRTGFLNYYIFPRRIFLVSSDEERAVILERPKMKWELIKENNQLIVRKCD